MKKITAKDLLIEVRKLKKVAGTLVEVWFPAEYFSFGDLESSLMDAPIGGKFVDGPVEYHVQGDLEELKFIWNEILWKDYDEPFEKHIVKRLGEVKEVKKVDVEELYQEGNWGKNSPNWDLLQKYSEHDVWEDVWEINLSKQGLSALSPLLLKLPSGSLERLNLAQNKFKTLPNWISKLTGLEDLSLSRNNFKEVPKILLKMKNLDYVDLWGNPITYLPEWLAQTSFELTIDIEKIDLSNASQKLLSWVDKNVSD